MSTARLPAAEPLNHETTAKFHALHHVVLSQFAVGGWNICSAGGMEAKHKEVRTTALRVNDRETQQCDMGRQVGITGTLDPKLHVWSCECVLEACN